jgi:hypothetical protein
MSKLSFQTLTLWLVLSLFIAGAVTTLLGFLGLLWLPLSGLLLIPVWILILIGLKTGEVYPQLGKYQKCLVVFLVGVWVLHGLNVVTPETGFDAVWYHLPVVEGLVQAHRLVVVPGYYQSLNPLFSDLIFLLGYLVKGELGTKVVAFIFGLSLILSTYQLARIFLSRSWSLITVLLISTFQVVAWQASSFYIDVAKAMWEISSLWLLLRSDRSFVLSGLTFGASVASKLFSVFLIPVFLVIALLQGAKPRLQAASILVALSLAVALPFYAHSYLNTGHFFLSFAINTAKVGEFSGNPTFLAHLVERTLSLPWSLIQLTLLSRDYITFAILLLLPGLVINRRGLWQDKRLMSLLLFSAVQWCIWWYLPPLSTRYALSGFITLILVLLVCLRVWCQKYPTYFKPMMGVLVLAILFNLAPRLAVAYRSSRYILGTQVRQEYLNQFKDGSIDSHLEKWQQLK